MPRLLLILLLALSVSLAWAQEPTPVPSVTPVTPATSEAPVAEPSPSPPPTNSLIPLPFPTLGDDTQAKVFGPFSGRHLFTISGAEGHSAAARAEKIRNRLKWVAEVQGDQASLVGMTRYNSNAVTITANERVLVTITAEDLDVIDARHLPTETLLQMQMEVAEVWQRQLQRELYFAAYIETPDYLKVAVPLSILVTLLAALLHYHLRKAKLLRLGTTVWGIEFLLWGGIFVFNLWLFPLTKDLAHRIHEVVISPFFRIWLVLLLGTILSNILEIGIHRYFTLLLQQSEMRPRRAQRLKTFSSVACKTVRWIMMIVVFFVVLAMLPFDLTPFLTSAGVIGIALGLAAQDLLKDILAGIGILIEDRFGVGDWIEWDKYSGAVETVNLQYTQIRTIQGGLVHVPNSDLRVVNNLSNEWAQVDFKVRVSYRTDIERAIQILDEEARKLCEDRKDQVLGEPVSKGVQELGLHGVTLRLYLRTQPLLQWDVERELNRRVKLRFDKEKIEIALPESVVSLRKEGETPP